MLFSLTHQNLQDSQTSVPVITDLVNGVATVFSVQKLLQNSQICSVFMTRPPSPFYNNTVQLSNHENNRYIACQCPADFGFLGGILCLVAEVVLKKPTVTAPDQKKPQIHLIPTTSSDKYYYNTLSTMTRRKTSGGILEQLRQHTS